MPVAQFERQRSAASGRALLCGQRRFGRREQALRGIAGALVPDSERRDKRGGARLRRARAERIRVALDVYIGADGRILDIDKQVSAASHGRDVVAKLTQLTS